MNRKRYDKEGNSKFLVSRHAANRYIERFEGNITLERAYDRIKRIFRDARFVRVAPGNARVYATHGIIFVVERNRIKTVYGVDTNGSLEDGYALKA